MPASAAPPATNGVFAFEARSPTFPPAFPSEPFKEAILPRAPRVLLALGLDLDVLDALDEPDVLDAPDEPFLVFEVREVLDEPLPPVDLFELERLRVDRLLEDRVVWAICYRLSWLSLPAAPFAPAVHLDLPVALGI